MTPILCDFASLRDRSTIILRWPALLVTCPWHEIIPTDRIWKRNHRIWKTVYTTSHPFCRFGSCPAPKTRCPVPPFRHALIPSLTFDPGRALGAIQQPGGGHQFEENWSPRSPGELCHRPSQHENDPASGRRKPAGPQHASRTSNWHRRKQTGLHRNIVVVILFRQLPAIDSGDDSHGFERGAGGRADGFSMGLRSQSTG